MRTTDEAITLMRDMGFILVSEAASLSKTSRSTINRLALQGLIASKQHGSIRFVSLKDVMGRYPLTAVDSK